MKHEKLNPTLPAGHRWRKDYVLELDPGTHKRRYFSGYYTLTAVELVAGVLVFAWIILFIRNAAALQQDAGSRAD